MIRLFLAAIAFIGIAGGVRLLLPLALRRSASYGTLLWDALRGRPTGEVLFLVTALIHDGQQGVRPRDWSSKMLDLALRLTENTDLAERVTVCLLAFYRAADLHEMALAASYLDEAVAKANPKSGTLYAWVTLEKAFYEAWFKRDRIKLLEPLSNKCMTGPGFRITPGSGCRPPSPWWKTNLRNVTVKPVRH